MANLYDNFGTLEFITDIKGENGADKQQIAFQELVPQYSEQLLKHALKLGFSMENAQDLVANSFATFYEIIGKFRRDSHIRTFLFGIFYKKVHEIRRTNIKHDHQELNYFDDKQHWLEDVKLKSPEEFAELMSDLNITDECIKKMDERQSLALYMRLVEEQEVEEICQIMGITYTNLRKLIARARANLRACVEMATAL